MFVLALHNNSSTHQACCTENPQFSVGNLTSILEHFFIHLVVSLFVTNKYICGGEEKSVMCYLIDHCMMAQRSQLYIIKRLQFTSNVYRFSITLSSSYGYTYCTDCTIFSSPQRSALHYATVTYSILLMEPFRVSTSVAT